MSVLAVTFVLCFGIMAQKFAAVASLTVLKQPQSHYMFLNTPFSLRYTLTNFGEKPVYDVHFEDSAVAVKDGTSQNSDEETASEEKHHVSFSVGEIAANSKISFIKVVTAEQYVRYYSHDFEVQYSEMLDDGTLVKKVMNIAAEQQFRVYSYPNVDFNSHFTVWLILIGIMCYITISPLAKFMKIRSQRLQKFD